MHIMPLYRPSTASCWLTTNQNMHGLFLIDGAYFKQKFKLAILVVEVDMYPLGFSPALRQK